MNNKQISKNLAVILKSIIFHPILSIFTFGGAVIGILVIAKKWEPFISIIDLIALDLFKNPNLIFLAQIILWFFFVIIGLLFGYFIESLFEKPENSLY